MFLQMSPQRGSRSVNSDFRVCFLLAQISQSTGREARNIDTRGFQIARNRRACVCVCGGGGGGGITNQQNVMGGKFMSVADNEISVRGNVWMTGRSSCGPEVENKPRGER